MIIMGGGPQKTNYIQMLINFCHQYGLVYGFSFFNFRDTHFADHIVNLHCNFTASLA